MSKVGRKKEVKNFRIIVQRPKCQTEKSREIEMSGREVIVRVDTLYKDCVRVVCLDSIDSLVTRVFINDVIVSTHTRMKGEC